MNKAYSNEELTAYLDGQADPELADAIAAQLEDDLALQAQIAALDIDVAMLREGMDHILPSAPEGLVPPAPAATPSDRAGLLTAVAASLVIGFGAGALLFQKPAASSPGWVDYVAAYQALYVPTTLADAPAEAEGRLAELGAVLGRDLAEVPAAPDLDYRRGQVLGFNGKPLIQLAFLSPSGEPVALCIIRSDAGSKPVSTTQLEGMQAATWGDETHQFLLIGGSDAAVIEAAASYFQPAV